MVLYTIFTEKSNMRLFIAIGLQENIKEYLINIQESIGNALAKIMWVNDDQMHLTLNFLGEVNSADIDKIKENLSKVKFEEFSFCLDSIGVFPNENFIRVVWIGIKPEEKVIELKKDIDNNLKGFKEDYKFKPHITLGRVKFVEDKNKFVKKLKKIKVENRKIDVRSFKLIKSTLTKQGPVYEELYIFNKFN